MKFKMEDQKAFLVHVNARKEAEGEDVGARLATDIKVRCEGMSAAELKALCPVDSTAKMSIVESLFNEAGSPRFYGLGGIDLMAHFDEAEVVVAGILFKEAKLKGFCVTKFIEGRKIDLQFTIQVHPTETQAGHLCGKIKTDIKVTVQPQPELDLEPKEAQETDGKGGNLALAGGSAAKH